MSLLCKILGHKPTEVDGKSVTPIQMVLNFHIYCVCERCMQPLIKAQNFLPNGVATEEIVEVEDFLS